MNESEAADYILHVVEMDGSTVLVFRYTKPLCVFIVTCIHVPYQCMRCVHSSGYYGILHCIDRISPQPILSMSHTALY